MKLPDGSVLERHASLGVATNNVGELQALIFALCWYLHSRLSCPCIIAYDSEFAANTKLNLLYQRQ